MAVYLHRGMETRLRSRLQRDRLVILEGARATGKSSLVDHALEEGWLSGVRDFMDPTELAAAREAPQDYVANLSHGTAIDEAQLCEAILLPLKQRIETGPPGAFLLTGSTRLRRDELGGSDPLAGRVGTALQLGPLTLGERRGEPVQVIEHLLNGDPSRLAADASLTRSGLAKLVAEPGLPALSLITDVADRSDRARAYVAQVVSASPFESLDTQRINQLARFLAGRTSTLVNVNDFHKQTGISRPTVEKYLSRLEEALILVRLKGWRRAKDKSETSRAKLHYFDAGVAHAVGRLRPDTDSNDLGKLTETLVVTDLLRQSQWLPNPPDSYHWRWKDNAEVDLVLEFGDGRALCFEVKAAERVSARDFRGIDAFRDHHGRSFSRGFVFHAGTSVVSFGNDRWAIPIGSLRTVEEATATDPMTRVIHAVGLRRQELATDLQSPTVGRYLIAARRQLEVLGAALERFIAEVRLVDEAAVLLVRPDRVPTVTFDGALSGSAGDPIRLVVVQADEPAHEVTAVVETRPGTMARTPVRQPMDGRDPDDVVAAALADLVEDVAFELTRIEQEIS